MSYTIKTDSLSKRFGDIQSVDNITIDVEQSEVYGFLGSNGAGKSTTMKMLTTLLRPTSGSARVAGYDIATQPSSVREHIGFVQQESAIDEYLTGRENLILQARLSRLEPAVAKRRIDELMETTGLADRQHDATVTYSGGMKKRLDIASGLLHRPTILFLDEPTVGLDIQTRHRIWEHIHTMHKEYDMTVFLSTHYMEEADMLCDRICIIDQGKVKAVGRPSQMKESLEQEVIKMRSDNAVLLSDSISSIDGVQDIQRTNDTLQIHVSDGPQTIPVIFQKAQALNIQIQSVSMTGPTLDDVYISYTGHQIREQGPEPRRKRRW